MTEDADGFLYESPAEEREREERETMLEERATLIRTKRLHEHAEKLAELTQVLAGWLREDFPEPPELNEAHDLIVEIAETLGKVAPTFAPIGQKISADALLRIAGETIGERGEKYGNIDKRFRDLSKMWSLILGEHVAPHQVALCMVSLKMVRLIETPDHLDSWIDCAAYAALGCQLAGVEGEG